MSAIGGQTPGAPPPPATRTLSVVLREALAGGNEVRMLVAKGLADSASALPNPAAYMNIELEGQQVTVPKLAASGLGGSATGYAVYVLATPDFLLAVGTVASSAGGVVGAGTIPIGGGIEWFTNTPPPGWLIANGQGFSAVTYPDLAQVFPSLVLPDLRRRVPVGAGSGGYDIGVNEGVAEASRAPYHYHHVSAVTSVVGDHVHGGAGLHHHGTPNGEAFATSIGNTGTRGTAATTFNLVTGTLPMQTSDDGNHQHPGAGQHNHGIEADTSGGNQKDGPAFQVVNFIIRAL